MPWKYLPEKELAVNPFILSVHQKLLTQYQYVVLIRRHCPVILLSFRITDSRQLCALLLEKKKKKKEREKKKEKDKPVTFVLWKVLLVWEMRARAASVVSSERKPLVHCPFSVTPHVDSTAEAGMHCMGKQPTLLQF